MSLHMIKLCVGVAKVETLERRAAKGEWLTVHTRMTPKRAAELEDGGSLRPPRAAGRGRGAG